MAGPKRRGLGARQPADVVDKAVTAVAAAGQGVGDDKRKALAVRLDEDTWEELRLLAFKLRVSGHAVLLRGVILAFREHGIDPTPYLLENAAPGEDRQGDLLKA